MVRLSASSFHRDPVIMVSLSQENPGNGEGSTAVVVMITMDEDGVHHKEYSFWKHDWSFSANLMDSFYFFQHTFAWKRCDV